jgi:predicted ATP-binding protein involved in virulence
MYDSVDSALNEIQEMFHNHVRQKAQNQYAISEQFRKKVFAESFKVEENYPISNIEYSQELEKLEKRRQELNNAIDNLDVKDLSKQFAEYFDSTKRALEILSSTSSFDETGKPNQEYVKALLQWVIKSSQIEKIDNIIRYANEYSNSIQRLKDPINRFVDSVNLFFKESRKEIEIDNKGEITIKAENTKKSFTVFELSSGEKQLIIMLAHIAFNYKNKNSSILIIDEPELSLHISWQELFVDALLKASPNAQYILATHAPAIIAHVERRDNCIDLTNMN